MAGRQSEDESLPTQVQELWQLVVGYAKQETLAPIKGLGRFVGFGLGAALSGSLGVVLLLLGGLRLLQTETGSAFKGWRSFIPYVVVLVISGGTAFGALRASSRGPRRDGQTP